MFKILYKLKTNRIFLYFKFLLNEPQHIKSDYLKNKTHSILIEIIDVN